MKKKKVGIPMDKKREEKLSRLMSYVLRHKPESYGIVLDNEGYCRLSDLVVGLNSDKKWETIKEEDVLFVVEHCEKKRYELTENKIRARYGHSKRKLAYQPSEPPENLLHGTNEGVVEWIKKEGLRKMDRQYVHLSEGEGFSKLAGERRGKLVFVKVEARKASQDGINFYHAGEDVWLSDDIPASYLTFYR